MTDDLRFMVKQVRRALKAIPPDLVDTTLDLLTALEETAERLRVALADLGHGNDVIMSLFAEKEAAERERDAVLEQLAERMADWNIALGRAERAETAPRKMREALEREWRLNHDERCTNKWPHTGECYYPRLGILEGREEKP